MGYFFAGLAGFAIGIVVVILAALLHAAKVEDEKHRKEELDDFYIGIEPYDGGDDRG